MRSVPTAHGATPTHARPRWRRAALLATLAVGGLLLPGCFSITSQTTAQRDAIGDLQITTAMCLQDGPGTCDNGTSYTTDPDDFQFLLGYLTPSWAVPPTTVSWTGDLGSYTLERDLSYENALQTFSPPPIGQRWVGFSAPGVLDAIPADTPRSMTATASLGIPTTAPGSLELATVTGWRRVRAGDLPADRPYSCAERDGGAPSTICILSGAPQQADSPTEATTPGRTPITTSIALNTLSLSAPSATASAKAGASVSLTFNAVAQDAASATVVPITVESTIPGATFDAPAALLLDRATGPILVGVKIPATTPTGSYTVTLRTTSGLRAATARLSITGSITAAPVKVTSIRQAAKLLAKYLKATPASEVRRGNTFDLPVSTPGVGRVAAKLTRGGKVLAEGTARAKTASAIVVRLQATRAGRRILRTSKLRGTLTLKFYGRKGVTTAPGFTVTLG